MTSSWLNMQRMLKQRPTFRNMFRMMERYNDAVCGELTKRDGERIIRTYKENAEMAYVCCGHLQNNPKFLSGKPIGLILDTCLDWPVLFWGILMAGGIPIMMNPAMDHNQLSKILEEAEACGYIGEFPLKGWEELQIPVEELLLPGERGKEIWAKSIILCTSGTTGNSRVFYFGEDALSAQIFSFKSAYLTNPDLPFEEDYVCKQLAFLPFYHVFGLTVVYLLYALCGKTMVYLRDKSITTIFETCKSHEVTHFFCVPMFFNALAAALKKKIPAGMALDDNLKKMVQDNLMGTQIKMLICGGGHLPLETLGLINDIGYQMIQGYGLTECGVICFELSTDIEKRKKGSIGRPFLPTEYKLEPEKEGELFLRGDALFTASMVDGELVQRDKNEWFATGDIVRDEEDGLYIVGRVKDVIINSSGENIYPDILEDQFEGKLGNAKYCITGIKNGAYEDVTLVTEKDENLSDQDIVALVNGINEKLNVNERITKLIVSENSLPLSGAMKIRKQLVKQNIEEKAEGFREISLREPEEEDTKSEAKENVPHVMQGIAFESLPGIKSQVRRVISEMLSVDEGIIGDNTDFLRDLAGDSLTVFTAINTLEDQYGLMFTDEEIARMTSVETAARVILAKLHGVDETRVVERPVVLKTHRITDFKNSQEYAEIQKRKVELFNDVENPYFLPHDSLISDTSVIRGEKVINLGSYNYLGMSGDPETMQAAKDAIDKYGTSASGSRTLAGEKTLYQQLERTIADWKHTEDAIVCTGGWATNLTFISSFMKEGDFILYDALSHNSITEGVALSKAESKAFPHNDLEALEGMLRKIEGRYNKVLIVIEGVYSMDGDIAPVQEFVRLKKQYQCFLMVDEAHSGGVIGDHGGGVDDYFSLEADDIDIKYGTLSKALGTCGGYIAADSSIVEYLRYSMNGFVFSAGIAPPLAAACMKAIELIQRDNTRVKNLHRNIEYFVRRCKEEGMDTCFAGESGIVPVLIGSDKDAAMLSSEMLKRGVFVPPAMYPAVPKGSSRLRFTISSTHSIEQLEKAVTELSKLMKEYGFLQG